MADNWEDVRTLYMSSDGGKTWTSPGPTTSDNYPAVSGDPGDRMLPSLPTGVLPTKEMLGKKCMVPIMCSPTIRLAQKSSMVQAAITSSVNRSWRDLVKSFDASATSGMVAYDQTKNRIYAAIGESNQTSHLYQWENGTLSDITDRLPSDTEGKKPLGPLQIDPIDPRVVYAGNYNGWRMLESVAVMRSTDAGATWTSLTLKPGDAGIDGGGRNTNTLRVKPGHARSLGDERRSRYLEISAP